MDTPRRQPTRNKYREALELLQRSRAQLVEEATDHILDQGEEILEQNYLFHEFLENQGTRLHFLTLLAGQIEQSADDWDEARARETPEPAPRPARKSSGKPRRRKAVEPAPESEPGET